MDRDDRLTQVAGVAIENVTQNCHRTNFKTSAQMTPNEIEYYKVKVPDIQMYATNIHVSHISVRSFYKPFLT